jgi:hypothetical protein
MTPTEFDALVRTTLAGIFVLAALLVAVVRASRFCTMGTISDVVYLGDLGRMRQWAMAIGVALCGFGMVLASGCGIKNLVSLGEGNLKSLVVSLVMGLAALMTLKGLTAVWRVPRTGRAGRGRRPGRPVPCAGPARISRAGLCRCTRPGQPPGRHPAHGGRGRRHRHGLHRGAGGERHLLHVASIPAVVCIVLGAVAALRLQQWRLERVV